MSTEIRGLSVSRLAPFVAHMFRHGQSTVGGPKRTKMDLFQKYTSDPAPRIQGKNMNKNLDKI